jgi:hypothetical protein
MLDSRSLTYFTNISLSGRVFLWIILAQGLYTKELAEKMDFGDGKCTYCTHHPESIAHLIFHCPIAQRVWLYIFTHFKAPVLHSQFILNSNFLHLVDYCLGATKDHAARLLVLYETSWALWKARNSLEYDGLRTPVYHKLIAHTASLHAQALVTYLAKGKKKVRLRQAFEFIEQFSR